MQVRIAGLVSFEYPLLAAEEGLEYFLEFGQQILLAFAFLGVVVASFDHLDLLALALVDVEFASLLLLKQPFDHLEDTLGLQRLLAFVDPAEVDLGALEIELAFVLVVGAVA